ncbi:MAG: hypothetical protein AABW88_04435 [Nanoarchaeota archaeon]
MIKGRSINIVHLNVLKENSNILKNPGKYVEYVTISNSVIKDNNLIDFLIKFSNAGV